MASEYSSNNSLVAKCLVLLLIFQVSSIAIGQTVMEESELLSQSTSKSNTDAFSEYNLNYGYDLAGEQISVEAVAEGLVRSETNLDIYHNQQIQAVSTGTPTIPDVVISNKQELNACWHNLEGTVNYYWSDLEQNSKHLQIDEVLGTGDGVVNFDCAIAVKENGRASVLYTNGSDLKAGQIAYASSLYVNGDEWHTRTIFEDLDITDIQLAITPDHLEWGVFRDSNGALYRVNYTGAFWQMGLLDNGPVGPDFELEITSEGQIYLMYTKNSQAVLTTIFDNQITHQTVAYGDNLHHDIGLTLDGAELIQLFTTRLQDNQTVMSIERSLANQDNQLSTTPDYVIASDLADTTSSDMAYGDFNGDGFADLVHAEANAHTQSLTSNGRVSVFFGSIDGLSSVSGHTWEGVSDAQMLGNSLAVGDFNGDGLDDLAIGSPGANSNDGMVEFAFGSVAGFSDPLTSVSGVSQAQAIGEKYGYCVESVSDLNSDGNDELLVCSIDYEQGSDTGKIELFFGGDSGSVWSTADSPNQMLQGSNFGQSISAGGDLNGDGLADLVIGNTGDLTDSSGFSSVEIRYGTTTGYATNPDRSYQSISAGTLFGYQVEIINDLNDDGFDELFISEPYNTSGPFNSGNVWVFYGNSSGIADQPSVRIVGDANNLLGLNFASAGDTNADGFNDLLITRKGGIDLSRVELILGSSEVIDGSSFLVSQGSSDYGLVMATGLDSNNDNLAEFIFSNSLTDETQTTSIHLECYSRKLFEVTNLSILGESIDGKIQSSTDGKPSIILDVENITDGSGQTKLISLQSDAQSTYWSVQDLTAPTSPFTGGSNFVTTSSGSPSVFYLDDGLKLKTYTGYTGVESPIATLNSDVEYLSTAHGINGEKYLAYYSPFANQLMISQHTESGWSEEVAANDANISSPISLHIDSTGSPVIIYRNYVSKELNVATKGLQWTSENISLPGQLTSPSFSSLLADDDTILIAAMLDDGSFNNLSVITISDTVDVSFVAVESDSSTNLSLVFDDNNGLMLAALTSSGSLMVYEQASGNAIWSSILLPQPQNLGPVNSIQASGGSVPLIAVNSELNSVYARFSGNWEVVAHTLGEEFDQFALARDDSQIIIIGNPAGTDQLSWNAMQYSQGLTIDEQWHHSAIDGTVSQNGLAVTSSGNEITLYLKSTLSGSMTSVELYHDTDNDHIFDAIDELENIPNQWQDSDDDGYGDNQNAPLADACPTQSGTSSIIVLGCFDADNDGYDDLTDDCNTAFGLSWLGRVGCSDFDQDGWVDWSSIYPFGDIFSDNWKQAFDTDGDSYGDNHGPDCCDTWYDTNAPQGDEFPFDAKQYTDYDGDGYGDNSSDFIGGDACKFDYGTSYLDRLGCQDSDGDGASDPTNFWNQSMGADIWPNDPTQWADSDGDGYGDNGSKNATDPDYFPNNIAAAVDTDEDGYPDVFTEFYNGSNAQGLQIDGCPLVAGNSTNPFYGCIDSDGDNYRDIYTYDLNPTTGLRENQSGDAFPFDPNQWADADGDGFGDFQGGDLADVCPNAPGVINGTLGIGCPLIDGNDDDGDFVINEVDQCPDTQFGLLVDLNGCAENQLDDDSDGVTNDADICPATTDVTTVDANGCSEAQRQVDSDSDGVYDYLDLCDSTPASEVPDLDGCSLSQKDSDDDGITDDVDVCPDTPENYPVLADGCTDESAKEIDWDDDGYTEDDEYMFEPTQWADTDGDGYGDNPEGVDGDQCPSVSGTSTLDRLGCLDSDLDGYSDPTPEFAASPSGLADAFVDDATQWRDNDGDGYGDNATGLNPDLCPTTNPLYKTAVDLSGCAANERDTDDDGIVDSLDNCPDQARGLDGYSDGCPLEKQSDTSSSGMILGVSITTFIAIVAGIVVLLFLVIVILRNRGLDDEDWFEDDDDFDDDYQEDRLSFLDRQRGSPRQPQASMPLRQQTSQRQSPPRSGPTGGPPPRGPSQSPPQRSTAPSSGPPKFAKDRTQTKPRAPSKKVSRKVKKSNDSGVKVRRAVVDIEDDIFENIPKSAIDDAVADLGDISAEDERQLLMKLQEKGWNAPQSRAIINLAKTQSR